MRYYDAGRRVEYLALCGGAGGDILYEAAQRGCDTVLTGEIKHSDAVWLSEEKFITIGAGHYFTEICGVRKLTQSLVAHRLPAELSEASQAPFTFL